MNQFRWKPLKQAGAIVAGVMVLVVTLELVRGAIFGYSPDVLSALRSHLDAFVVFFLVNVYFFYSRGEADAE